MNKGTTNYMVIDGSSQRQVLYYLEDPKASFPEGSKEPTWTPIAIELPTRLMSDTERWLEDDDPTDLRFEEQKNGRITNSFITRKAERKTQLVRRSKVINNFVIAITLAYELAEKCNA